MRKTVAGRRPLDEATDHPRGDNPPAHSGSPVAASTRLRHRAGSINAETRSSSSRAPYGALSKRRWMLARTRLLSGRPCSIASARQMQLSRRRSRSVARSRVVSLSRRSSAGRPFAPHQDAAESGIAAARSSRPLDSRFMVYLQKERPQALPEVLTPAPSGLRRRPGYIVVVREREPKPITGFHCTSRRLQLSFLMPKARYSETLAASTEPGTLAQPLASR